MNIQKLMLFALSFGFVGTGFADGKPDEAAKCYLASLIVGMVHGAVNKEILKPAEPNHLRNATYEEIYSGMISLGANHILLKDIAAYKEAGVKEKCVLMHGVGQAVAEMSGMNGRPKSNLALVLGCFGYAWEFLRKS